MGWLCNYDMEQYRFRVCGMGCAATFIQARITHQWYLDQYADSYPKDRKAIIPSLI